MKISMAGLGALITPFGCVLVADGANSRVVALGVLIACTGVIFVVGHVHDEMKRRINFLTEVVNKRFEVRDELAAIKEAERNKGGAR